MPVTGPEGPATDRDDTHMTPTIDAHVCLDTHPAHPAP